MSQNILKRWLINFTENRTIQNIYYKTSIIVSILLVLSLIGVQIINPAYANLINTLVKIYVGVFLIIRFNPYIQGYLKKNQRFFDNSIAFAGGLYLIAEAITTNVLNKYKENLHQIIN